MADIFIVYLYCTWYKFVQNEPFVVVFLLVPSENFLEKTSWIIPDLSSSVFPQVLDG